MSFRIIVDSSEAGGVRLTERQVYMLRAALGDPYAVILEQDVLADVGRPPSAHPPAVRPSDDSSAIQAERALYRGSGDPA